MPETMKYQVRVIETGRFGAILLATDNADEAKRRARETAHDYYYGTAIIDTETQMVDCGDRIVPVTTAFQD